MYFSSRIFASVLGLQAVQEDEHSPQVSRRALQNRTNLEEGWDAATPVWKPSGQPPRLEESLATGYADLLKKDLGKRKENHGLLSQTIMEEEDDSEDGF